ncbi:hypothetical protein F4604DRAFT_1882172 [Suillus subluteus]|nr:hypothetical protein F4604DRAFT_1882172 [Suillus subluteus]
MRAAMSHKFGRQLWLEHPTIPGKHIGNPLCLVTISQYMVSLCQRKVWSGEAVTSAWAMDEATMKHLWDFLWATPHKEYGPTSCKRKAENPAEWVGFVICSMLLLLYLVSMICLLRYDEALRITWADITFQIAPFYVYADEQHPWMCLVRTFAVWWMLARERYENLDGFIFRKKIGTDSISVNPTDGMISNAFLKCVCNNLLDIGVDPHPYSRCQFLYKVCRWDFGDICDWGGWAENFDNPGMIFKYLLSWNDNPQEKSRKDPCHACGRTCHCA